MSELPERVRRAFADHEAFERTGEATFEATTTPLEATVRVRADESVRAEVTVRAPTLSAAVADAEDVATVVEAGWFETFERRMDQAHMPLRVDRDLDPTVGVDGDRVVVTASVVDRDARRAADDARALVEYVEGTYLEGVVPGYEYAEPIAGLLARARQAGDVDGG